MFGHDILDNCRNYTRNQYHVTVNRSTQDITQKVLKISIESFQSKCFLFLIILMHTYSASPRLNRISRSSIKWRKISSRKIICAGKLMMAFWKIHQRCSTHSITLCIDRIFTLFFRLGYKSNSHLREMLSSSSSSFCFGCCLLHVLLRWWGWMASTKHHHDATSSSSRSSTKLLVLRLIGIHLSIFLIFPPIFPV